MTDLAKVFKGVGLFVPCYFSILILNLVIPILIQILSEYEPFEGLSSIIWFFIVLLWVFMLIFLPNMYIIDGIKTDTNDSNNFVNTAVGILLFLTSCLITWKGWYFIKALGQGASVDGTGEPLIYALFWIGTIIIWIEITLIIPYYLIIKD